MLCVLMLPSYNWRSSKPCPGEPEVKMLSAELVWLTGNWNDRPVGNTALQLSSCGAMWEVFQPCWNQRAESRLLHVLCCQWAREAIPVSLCPMSASNFSSLISLPEVPPHGNVQTETDTTGSFSCSGQPSVEPGLGGKRAAHCPLSWKTWSPLPDGPLSCVDNPGTMPLAARQNQTESRWETVNWILPPCLPRLLERRGADFLFSAVPNPRGQRGTPSGGEAQIHVDIKKFYNQGWPPTLAGRDSKDRIIKSRMNQNRNNRSSLAQRLLLHQSLTGIISTTFTTIVC